ncbi:MAG: hypothetical protein R3B72_07500 [Polyangiaceae bacterium]
MFFYITLHAITPHALEDNPHDLFDRRAELYQTWVLTQLEDAENLDSSAKWGRQGFSTRHAPDGATSFRKPDEDKPGERVRVIDPQITFALPEKLTKRTYRFDAHYWESDNGNATKKVRALFADPTLRYMVKAWEAASEDHDKARKHLLEWIDDNWKNIAEGLVAYAVPAAGGVVSRYNILELVEAIVKLAASGADDYHQHHRFIFQIIQDGDAPKWRVISPSGDNGTAFKKGYGTQKVVETVRADAGDTRYDVEWRFRLLES